MTSLWKGGPTADAALETLRQQIGSAGATGPTLVSVHRGEPTPFSVYLGQQAKVAARAGVGFRSVVVDPTGSGAALRSELRALDRDPTVHAVLVEHPLPPEWEFQAALAELRPEKDVDGVGTENLGRLAQGRPLQVPAVARAAIRIAEVHGVRWPGTTVAVVGRSETVGRPIATLLGLKGTDATVTLAHSRTSDLGAALRGASVVFSCVGLPGLLNRSNVPADAAVIDVGLSTVDDPSHPKGRRVVGDADLASLDGWARAVTPVPGGVGPLTVACLMENAARGWAALRGAP